MTGFRFCTLLSRRKFSVRRLAAWPLLLAHHRLPKKPFGIADTQSSDVACSLAMAIRMTEKG